MKLFGLVLLAGAFAASDAACANQCSGNGKCGNGKPSYANDPTKSPYAIDSTYESTGGMHTDIANQKKDTCTCFTRQEGGDTTYAYKGVDCSLKTCQSGKSWASTSHTTMAECSDAGKCNRETGQCECDKNHSGSACQRRTCPSKNGKQCSGNGRCLSMEEIIELVSERDAQLEFSTASLTYTAFDSDVSFGCLCDANYHGADCSMKECPSGADVMGGDGASSGNRCSGRGMCDDESGKCMCFRGYTGNRCQSQRPSSSE